MAKFDVIDGDGFVVKTFPTREAAQKEIDDTLAEYRREHPAAWREGTWPRLSIRETTVPGVD